MKRQSLAIWIEAMRLRTLPVSVAGVMMAWAFGLFSPVMRWTPALLCLVFAVLAQIASNFANEYYDFKRGLDRPGRDGPRRGVTEGDITPRAMKRATFLTLAAACLVGLSLVAWGGWWLIVAGVLIALGVIAYSAGPWPLSHHGLGEVAVVFFFGLVPVNLTYYLITGTLWEPQVGLASLSVGLMGANVLIVNNYRDRDDDMAVGKRTLAVRFGRGPMAALYLINGYVAVALMSGLWLALPAWMLVFPAVYLIGHTALYIRISISSGPALNPCLGLTSIAMFFYSASLLVCAII